MLKHSYLILICILCSCGGCLDEGGDQLLDLKEVWKVKVTQGLYSYTIPAATTSTVTFATTTGEVHGFSIQSGAKKWATKVGQTSQPIVNRFRAYGGHIYFDYSNRLICFDGESGAIDWQFVKSQTYGTLSDPEPSEEYVFTGDSYTPSGYNEGNIFCVLRGSGQLNWKRRLSEGVNNIAASTDGYVYVTTQGFRMHPERGEVPYGLVYCFNSQTGDLIWSYDVSNRPNAGFVSGAADCRAAIWQDRVFIVNSSGSVFCLNRFTGTEIWIKDLQSGSFAGMTVDDANQRGFVVAGIEFYCLTLDSGNLVWRSNSRIGESAEWEPELFNGVVYNMGSVGFVEARDALNGQLLYQSIKNHETFFRFGSLQDDCFYMLNNNDNAIMKLKPLR
ncbi:MAG TPA: PQQ-binding-like beta-propeller repeat protein [bacterium]|nr:PQQ-binding-like beta-propeller repeat protein [bacterium]HNM13587.1 PQQ-binding-like beta-propeller repeat protein [bacterium]HNO09307.1 PQQ-binding-like beta-propeller repeat protein [bacterium]